MDIKLDDIDRTLLTELQRDADRTNLDLARLTAGIKGQPVPLNLTLTTKKFPMNWVLSRTAVNRLQTTVSDLIALRDTLDRRDKLQLKNLFVYDTTRWKLANVEK